MGRKKHYVEVVVKTDVDGQMVPLSIDWGWGKPYQVEGVLDKRHAVSLTTGAEGLRYTVKIGKVTTYLYYENPRWFVEEKVASMP